MSMLLQLIIDTVVFWRFVWSLVTTPKLRSRFVLEVCHIHNGWFEENYDVVRIHGDLKSSHSSVELSE
jgi:hypothetical protein